MFKLYSQSTQQIKPYPRNDDEPIIGLDPDYLVFTQVDTATPEYDDTTHTINSTYVVNIDTLEYIQEWIVTEKTISIPPDWDMFNLQMMSDARFNQVYNQCLSVAPIVCSALPVALDQITSKGNTLFTLIWNQLCSIGGATVEDKIVWGEYATNNNLPLDFIEVLTA